MRRDAGHGLLHCCCAARSGAPSPVNGVVAAPIYYAPGLGAASTGHWYIRGARLLGGTRKRPGMVALAQSRGHGQFL